MLRESTSNPEDTLNSANCIKAINTLAVNVTYRFNTINWTIPEIRRFDTKICKLSTCNRMHHLKTDVNKLYIPRNKGENGMIQLKLSYKTSTIDQHNNLPTKTAWMLQLVLEYDKTKT